MDTIKLVKSFKEVSQTKNEICPICNNSFENNVMQSYVNYKGIAYCLNCFYDTIYKEIEEIKKVFIKYKLESFFDLESGNIVIPCKDFKSVESQVNKLLKENKNYHMNLYNQNWINEPHYMIFNKNKPWLQYDNIKMED